MFPQLTSLWQSTLRLLPGLAVGLAVVLVVAGAGKLLGMGARRGTTRLGRDPAVATLIGRLVQWSVGFVGLLVGVTIAFPSFRADDLVQMLGIVSVAIGFAFRDILQNFLAGVILLWSRPFRIGDQIVHAGHEGTVVEIQTRATHLDTYDGRVVIIPNAELFTKAVVVNTGNPERRVEYDVGIGVDEDIERARTLILDTLHALDGVLARPAPDVRVVELGDFSIKLRVRWWISPPRFREVVEARDVVLARVKERLTAAGVVLPFPTTTVHLTREADA